MDEYKLKALLKGIAEVESSGGKNTNHPYQGERTTPVGTYGMKPTANDTTQRRPASIFPGTVGVTSSQLTDLIKADIPDSLKRVPGSMEEELVRAKLKDIYKKYGNVKDTLAAYNQGEFLPKNELHRREEENDKLVDYLEKAYPVVIDEMKKTNPLSRSKPIKTSEDILNDTLKFDASKEAENQELKSSSPLTFEKLKAYLQNPSVAVKNLKSSYANKLEDIDQNAARSMADTMASLEGRQATEQEVAKQREMNDRNMSLISSVGELRLKPNTAVGQLGDKVIESLRPDHFQENLRELRSARSKSNSAKDFAATESIDDLTKNLIKNTDQQKIHTNIPENTFELIKKYLNIE